MSQPFPFFERTYGRGGFLLRSAGHKFRFAGLGDGVFYAMETIKDDGSSYYVEASGVASRVCELILKMNPTNIDQIVVGDSVYTGDTDICGSEDNLAMKFCFGEDGAVCDGSGSFDTNGCTDDLDCPDKQVCINGKCQNPCMDDEDCSEGQVCKDGKCVEDDNNSSGGNDGSELVCGYGALMKADKSGCYCDDGSGFYGSWTRNDEQPDVNGCGKYCSSDADCDGNACDKHAGVCCQLASSIYDLMSCRSKMMELSSSDGAKGCGEGEFEGFGSDFDRCIYGLADNMCKKAGYEGSIYITYSKGIYSFDCAEPDQW